MKSVPRSAFAQVTDGTETPTDASTSTPTPNESEAGGLPSQLYLENVPDFVIELAATALVIVLAYAVARLVVRLFGRRLARRFDRPSLTRTALSGIRAGIYVLALLVILRINGVPLGNIALSVTVFTAVVGVILAPIVGSVISGVFLLADQPYEIGDMIQLDAEGKRGFVEDITLRYTKIFTLDNTFLVIPNGTIRDRDVYNFSAEDPRTRISLSVLITYESDVPLAQDRLEAAARSVDGVIEGGPSIRIGSARYPAAPDCLIEQFADHGVRLTLRFWVRAPYRIQTVKSAVQENIYTAVREEDDLAFAYPHSHLYFDETSGSLDVDGVGGPTGAGSGGPRPRVRGHGRPERTDSDDVATAESETVSDGESTDGAE